MLTPYGKEVFAAINCEGSVCTADEFEDALRTVKKCIAGHVCLVCRVKRVTGEEEICPDCQSASRLPSS